VTQRELPGRARANTAKGHGSGHWLLQRLTSVALVPLGVWFLASLASLPALDYGTVTAWIGRGWAPIGLVLLILTTVYHSQLGLRVVIEDYVHAPHLKNLALFIVTVAHLLLAIAGGGAVLKQVFGAPA
jgi:succinate dehydrogenase / fumarate reductase, membrane anchor subunit